MATLSQGPQPQFRNMLADAIQDYTPTLANRLNDPTSGAGLAVDAVGGLADMLIGQPYRSMTNLLSRPYVSGDPQAAEDAFNVAGAAMVGGLAAPRPRNSLGTGGRPEAPGTVRAYRGSNNEFSLSDFDPAASNPGWRTNEGALFFGSRDTANVYGAPQTKFDQSLISELSAKHTTPDGRLNVRAMNEEYAARAEPDGAATVMPADINTTNFGRANLSGYRWDSDEGARLKAAIDAAKAQGRDGLSITGMMDASGYRDPQYAVWGRGTVTSPLTGELLYANGGQFGGLAGLLSGYGYQQQQPNQLADWTRNLRPGDI